VDVIVREAVPSDATIWLRLRQRLWPDADPSELGAHVEDFFGRGSATVAVVFLAFDAHNAVGFAELSLRPYVPGATSIPAPFLEGWFVEPSARRQGVGRALIRAAERRALERGHRELGSDTILDNESAALAHQALGFREVERVRFFVKRLEPDGATVPAS